MKTRIDPVVITLTRKECKAIAKVLDELRGERRVKLDAYDEDTVKQFFDLIRKAAHDG